MANTLAEKIATKRARVAVLGLGYVGVPVSVAFAEAGFTVTGVDVDADRVKDLKRGRSYIPDVADARLVPLLDSGRFGATTDSGVLREADAIVICVPTPLSKTKDPDLSFVRGAADALLANAHRDLLVVLESTSYPGTTDELFAATLTRAGYRVGTDIYVAFSPERIDPGSTESTLENTPKVIGGVTPACLEMASSLYAHVVKQVVPVSSAKAAEMVKLLENTFRAVNVALANEMALMCDRLGIDVWEVIDGASTKPFGFMRFEPGPGLGGHCLPVDPIYLSWKLRTLNYEARFIELASAVNSSMPEVWVNRVVAALNEQKKAVKGSRILVLGVAYKPEVNDARESPALEIISLLVARGAHVTYHDPYVGSIVVDDARLESVPLSTEALAEADCVVIATHHKAIDWDVVRGSPNTLVDTRGVLRRGLVGGDG